MGLQGANLAGTSTTRDRVDNDYKVNVKKPKC